MLRIYNTYTKQVSDFTARREGVVTMYNCGPTVYDHPHIGNFRAFLFADLLRRYLEFKGFSVKQVMNITDVGHLTMDDVEQGEDKLEAAARRNKTDPWAIARTYTEEFFSLIEKLNIKKAEVYPKATEHVSGMVEWIQKLIDKGFAYVTDEGVYYRISKFPSYGLLSGNTSENLVAGKRVPKNPKKENPLDFALWKVDPRHIMKWQSPWGEGFPGWHIECSVMSTKYLGETIDIHTGGEDNIFPHHESEIAQSEALSGRQFVRYWMHTRHLLVAGAKMSKSAGNFYTVNDILQKGYKPRALRYLLISAHYRSNLNFSFDALESASSAADRLCDLDARLAEIMGGGNVGSMTPKEAGDMSVKMQKGFEAAMDEDLNIAKALGCVFDFVSEVNRRIDGVGSKAALVLRDALRKVDSVLGCIYGGETRVLTKEQENLIAERELARKSGDYARSDEIRRLLLSQGIELVDTRSGTKWKFVR